jgi:hypothetical protein
MGGGGSKSSPAAVTPTGPATLESLAATGRYVVLPRKEDAGDVHLIGVFPCSSTSGREVADLISLVQPKSIYVDLFPEQIELYKGEIKELMAAVDAVGPEKALADARKKLGELPPISNFYSRSRGLSVATELRHMIADEWFFRLLGVGRDAPYMTAIVQAVANPAITLAGYPLPMSYPSRSAVIRIAATMTSLVGDPPTYFNTLATLGLAGAQRPDVVFEMCTCMHSPQRCDDDNVVVSFSWPVPEWGGSDVKRRHADGVDAVSSWPFVIDCCLVSGCAAVPPVGFFTYENIAQLRGEFERQVNDAMKQLTLSNCDAENTISTVAPPEVLSALVKQNYAAAHAIQVRVAVSGEGRDRLDYRWLCVCWRAWDTSVWLSGCLVATARFVQSLPRGPVVAVVDIGRGRGIMKAWNAAQPAHELFPPQPWYSWERTQNKVFAGVGLSTLSYGAYQGWKRCVCGFVLESPHFL